MKIFNWYKTVCLAVLVLTTPNVWAATANDTEATYSKADYDKLVNANMAQQATIYQEMAIVLSHNYFDFPGVVTLVDDALSQLNSSKGSENLASTTAEKGDWQNAVLESEKWQQYLDKAMNFSSQAKTSLLEQSATQIIGETVTSSPVVIESTKSAEEPPIPSKAELYKDKTCLACHGKDANTPLMPTYPKLAGQNKEYAIAQMKDIKSGARNNGQTPAMKGIMHLVSDTEIEAIAEWLASLDNGSSSVTADSEGAKLYKNKTCLACHGKDANTPLMPIYPRLVGQDKEYIIAQMKDIKSGARNNGQTSAMKGIMHLVSDAEIEAIAAWLAASASK